jgi:hypothetical protein
MCVTSFPLSLLSLSLSVYTLEYLRTKEAKRDSFCVYIACDNTLEANTHTQAIAANNK